MALHSRQCGHANLATFHYTCYCQVLANMILSCFVNMILSFKWLVFSRSKYWAGKVWAPTGTQTQIPRCPAECLYHLTTCTRHFSLLFSSHLRAYYCPIYDLDIFCKHDTAMFFKHDTARFCFFYRKRLQTEETCPMFPDDCHQPHFNKGSQMS